MTQEETATATATKPARLLDLGRREFGEVWALQRELLVARQKGEISDTLILVEHPHVITAGRSAHKENLLGAVWTEPGAARQSPSREGAGTLSGFSQTVDGVPFFEIERGGDVTYHGPGQLVAYPIVLLRDGERDLHKYLRNLEEAVIRTCARFELAADREPGKTGVWTGDGDERKKLCSMGIACRKWVTFHGLALNVTTDLAYFARINPCGFESRIMSSLADRLGRDVDIAAAKRALIDELGDVLGRAAITETAASVA